MEMVNELKNREVSWIEIINHVAYTGIHFLQVKDMYKV
jgi:hypothetical protein